MKAFLKMSLAVLLVCTLLLSVSAEGLFDFSLPQGMHIPEEDITETDCPIICSGMRVGGVILTDLDPMELVTFPFSERIPAYFAQYVPESLVFEYMIGGYGVLDASIIMLDPETLQSREFFHYLFEKDGSVFDLWMDTRYLDSRQQTQLAEAIGIPLPGTPVDMPETQPDFDFGVPEGYTLGAPEGRSCPILKDGTPVGAIEATGLTELALLEDDGILNMADYVPDLSYAEDSTAEYAISRHLSQGLPETSGYEYILMYCTCDDGTPAVSIRWKVTDYPSEAVTESSHFFFLHSGTVYDLWLDCGLVDSSLFTSFRTAAGIR